MPTWTLLVLALLVLAQAKQPANQTGGEQEWSATAIEGRLRDLKINVPQTAMKRDADVLSKASAQGAFTRFEGGAAQKLELAATVWIVLRDPMAYKTKNSLPVGQFTVDGVGYVASLMGRLIVSSRPAGADIAVDGHLWKRKTDAEGYALEGVRKIVVSQGKTQIGVSCEVTRDGTVTASVDLTARSAVCK